MRACAQVVRAGPHLHSEHLEVVVLSARKLLIAEVGVCGEAREARQVGKEIHLLLHFQI